jgi:hypothetical protein
VGSNENVADIFTKVSSKAKFTKFAKMLLNIGMNGEKSDEMKSEGRYMCDVSDAKKGSFEGEKK